MPKMTKFGNSKSLVFLVINAARYTSTRTKMSLAPVFNHKLVFAEGPGKDDDLYVAVPYEDGHVYGSEAIRCFVSNDTAYEIEPGVTSMLQVLTLNNNYLTKENCQATDENRAIKSEMARLKEENFQLKSEIQISNEIKLNNLKVQLINGLYHATVLSVFPDIFPGTA